jgi:predicted MFS family arabinose efflux permease
VDQEVEPFFEQTAPARSTIAPLDPRVWLLAAGTFAIGTDAFVIAGILPQVAADLGISTETAGQIVSAYSFTYAAGAPFLAAAFARIDRQRIILAALAAFAATNLLCALAPAFLVLMAARVLAGACASLYTPTAYVTAAGLVHPSRRGAGLAAVAFGLSSSAVLGVPLGTWLGQHFGWRATFLLVAALSGVGTIALCVLRVGTARLPEATPGLAARLAPLARPAVLIALLPSFLWSTAGFALYTYIAPLAADRLPGANIAGLLLAFGIGGIVGSQLGGRIADRLGTTVPMFACLTVTMLNFALLPLTLVTLPSAVAALLIWAFFGWATFAPQQSRLLSIAPKDGAVVLSLNNSTIYFGSAAGAALGGILLAGGMPIGRLPLVGAALLLAAITALAASVWSRRA